MNKERLMRLVALLENETRRPKNFEFNLVGWLSKYNDYDYDDELNDPVCQTAGCAIGLALDQKEFADEGLFGECSPYLKMPTTISLRIAETLKPYDFYIHDDLLVGWAAVAVLFDITVPESEALFSYGPYEDAGLSFKGREGELNVANKIRDFVAAEVSA